MGLGYVVYVDVGVLNTQLNERAFQKMKRRCRKRRPRANIATSSVQRPISFFSIPRQTNFWGSKDLGIKLWAKIQLAHKGTMHDISFLNCL